MANTTETYRIVPGEESGIHDEPHVAGSRVTVQHVHARVEEAGMSPHRLADQLGLEVADVYEALAYYYRNPDEMDAVERQRAETVEATERLDPPE